jgi:hypothetical protein
MCRYLIDYIVWHVVGKELLSYVTANIMRLGNDPELYI